jgi:hypothetical protein
MTGNHQYATWRVAAFGLLLLSVTQGRAATPDRIYLFGNGVGENGADGANVGAANTTNPGTTLDDKGIESNPPTFSDLAVAGTPKYVATTGRPAAAVGDVGITFDGTDDRLSILNGFGYPQQADDVFGNPPNPNYETLTTRLAQGWVRPTGSTLNRRQDVFNDTYQFGIHITADNKWAMNYGSTTGQINTFTFASPTTVQYGQWSHVMQRTFNSRNGALYVNGVAVEVSPQDNPFYFAANGAAIGTVNDDMVFGSNLPGDNNFFQGDLDDWVFSVSGNNATLTNGANYGGVNVGVDNQYIASLNLVNGDANGDGMVNGNGTGPAASDDVTFFAQHFLERRLVDNFQIGDLVSRQQMADLNYDGITNLADWFVLVSTHQAGAAAGLSLEDALAGVPEPSALVLMVLGMTASMLRRRRCN